MSPEGDARKERPTYARPKPTPICLTGFFDMFAVNAVHPDQTVKYYISRS